MILEKNKLVGVYYVALLLIMVFLSRPEVSYSMGLRLVYFGMVLAPLFLFPKLTPVVITCFWGTVSNSFYSLLPDNYLYLIAVALVLFVVNFKSLNVSKIHWIYILFFFYTFLISILFGDYDQTFLKVLFLFIFLFPFIKNQEDVSNLSLSIVLSSFALALIYLRNFQYFSVNIGQTDFELGAWGNINMLAGAIACGLPLSVAMLTGAINVQKSLLIRIFLIASITILTIVLFMCGSRGALFAAGLSSLILILSVEGRRYVKLLVILGIVLLLTILYQNGVMDFFLYRMTELGTNESVGGRADIWNTKLSAFFTSDVFTLLFGMGRHNCDNFAVYYSTHNDFVTSLVGFGFFGFLIFCVFIFRPIIWTSRKHLFQNLALWFFLLMESFVLEPYFRGYILFYAFYFLLIARVLLQRKEEKRLQS